MRSRPIPWRSVALLAVMTLGGCATSSPDLAGLREAVVTPTPFTRDNTPSAAAPVTPVMPGAWWHRFGDPALTTWIDDARGGNAEVALAVARLDEARAIARLKRAGLSPDASLTLNGGLQRQLDDGQAASTRSYTGALVVGRELDLWGRLAQDQVGGQATVDGAVFSRDAALLDLSLAVAELYWQIAWLHAQLDAARDARADADAMTGLAEARWSAGVGTRDEVLQARQQAAARERERLSLERTLDQARSQLAVLTGRPPSWRSGREPRELPEALPSPPAFTPVDALAHRPDVAAAEAQLRASWAQAEQSRTSLYPSLKIATGIGTNGGRDLYRWLQDPIGSLAGSMLIALARPATLRATGEQASAQQRQAALSFQQRLRQALGDVAECLSARDHELALGPELERQLSDAREAVGLARTRMSAGQTGLQPVLIAEDNRRQAASELASSRHRLRVATARLLVASGHGVEAPAVEAPVAPAVRESAASAIPPGVASGVSRGSP